MDIVDLAGSATGSGLDVLLGHSDLGGLDDLGELGTGLYTPWSRWSRCSRRCRQRRQRTCGVPRVCGTATLKVRTV